MTFTQMQAGLIKAVRSVRKVYRRADTAGEKVERELDRLVKRKRLIQPDDLATCIKLYKTYAFEVDSIAKALVDAQTTLQAPAAL